MKSKLLSLTAIALAVTPASAAASAGGLRRLKADDTPPAAPTSPEEAEPAATTTQESPSRWYPNLDSYDEVRLVIWTVLKGTLSHSVLGANKATETMECIYDSSYPEIWNTLEEHLFETEETCCEVWKCHTEPPPSRWYPHFNSYDEVRPTCLRNLTSFYSSNFLSWEIGNRDDGVYL